MCEKNAVGRLLVAVEAARTHAELAGRDATEEHGDAAAELDGVVGLAGGLVPDGEGGGGQGHLDRSGRPF